MWSGGGCGGPHVGMILLVVPFFIFKSCGIWSSILGDWESIYLSSNHFTRGDSNVRLEVFRVVLRSACWQLVYIFSVPWMVSKLYDRISINLFSLWSLHMLNYHIIYSNVLTYGGRGEWSMEGTCVSSTQNRLHPYIIYVVYISYGLCPLRLIDATSLLYILILYLV